MPDEQRAPSFWAVLPAPVRYSPKLPSTAKLLYAEISALTGETGYCFATNAYFCNLYNISERTLQRHLRDLAALHMIAIEDGDGGKSMRRIYAGVNPLHTPVKNDGGAPSKTAGATMYQDNLSKPPIVPQRGRGADFVPKKAPDWKPERFEGFWAFYPLKKSKQATIRAWDRLKPSDELLAVIGRALESQIAESKRAAEKARRPWEWKLHASTYLNQARWTDETEADAPTSDADRVTSMREEAERQWRT